MAPCKLLPAAHLLTLYEPPQLALATHPDKNPDNEEATKQFQQISEAYHVLARYLDKSDHTHEHTDQFDEYEDEYDDDDGDHFFLDLEGLPFYLWVLCCSLCETHS